MKGSLATALMMMAIAGAASGQSASVTLSYLGAAGWQISDGKTVVLVDPYLSRIPISGVCCGYDRLSSFPRRPAATPSQIYKDARPAVGLDDVLVADTGVIDAHIERADYILVTHSHVDHIMDVPYIAHKTGATVVGHHSSINIVRATGISEDQLITVRGGEDYEFGTFSVKVVPSIHSPLFQKHYFDDRIIPSAIKPPFTLNDLTVEGGSVAYLIRIGGHEILVFGSMNYVEREIQGLRPDVALVGANPSRLEIHDYAGRLMRALGYPHVVLPTHWDNERLPYDAPQDAAKAAVRRFSEDVRAVSPTTRVIIPEYFKSITLDAPRRIQKRAVDPLSSVPVPSQPRASAPSHQR
jgi:L-ascorbate metabolism protein UlaG (beta-lactamase superfamily)